MDIQFGPTTSRCAGTSGTMYRVVMRWTCAAAVISGAGRIGTVMTSPFMAHW